MQSTRNLSRTCARCFATTAKSRAYKPALEPGALPAYDEAVKFLAADKERKQGQASKLRAQASSSGVSKEDGASLTAKAEELEILSELDDPEVRWRFRHGKGESCCSTVTSLC